MNIAVIDIGSPKKHKVGWAIVGNSPHEGTDLDECITDLSCALQVGPLALGFEAPMFVPMRDKWIRLTDARSGECEGGISRPFSAAAGASVLVTSMVVVPYVLLGLRRAVPDAIATLDWHSWQHTTAPKRLLLFEAFVSGSRKSSHIEDARSAANALHAELSSGEIINSAIEIDIDDEECFSVLGAMMVRTGWTSDSTVLSQSCLVVRPAH